MISHKHKCIFIHISKCAGSSVENAFGVYRNKPGSLDALRGWDDANKLYLQHATPQQLIDLNLISQSHWDSYYKFIIYRNSWSKLLSDYLWVKRTHKIEDSFNNFLNKSGGFYNALNDNSTPFFCGDHLYLQKDYFFLDGKPIIYDTAIDFDNIDCGFKKLKKDLKLSPNFFNNKDNVTSYKKKHYSYSYSLKSKQLVENYYADDINYFGFTFENRTGLPLAFNTVLRKTV